MANYLPNSVSKTNVEKIAIPAASILETLTATTAEKDTSSSISNATPACSRVAEAAMSSSTCVATVKKVTSTVQETVKQDTLTSLSVVLVSQAVKFVKIAHLA